MCPAWLLTRSWTRNKKEIQELENRKENKCYKVSYVLLWKTDEWTKLPVKNWYQKINAKKKDQEFIPVQEEALPNYFSFHNAWFILNSEKRLKENQLRRKYASIMTDFYEFS